MADQKMTGFGVNLKWWTWTRVAHLVSEQTKCKQVVAGGPSVQRLGQCSHRGSTGPAEPLLRTTATTNMAAANFVVITNGEGCALTGTADMDQ